MFNGEIHYKWAIFNSYVKLPKGIYALYTYVYIYIYEYEWRIQLLEFGWQGVLFLQKYP